MKTSAELITQYIKETNISYKYFCGICRISRASFYKYVKGLPIHPFKAKQIELGTQGKIKAADLIRKI